MIVTKDSSAFNLNPFLILSLRRYIEACEITSKETAAEALESLLEVERCRLTVFV